MYMQTYAHAPIHHHHTYCTVTGTQIHGQTTHTYTCSNKTHHNPDWNPSLGVRSSVRCQTQTWKWMGLSLSIAHWGVAHLTAISLPGEKKNYSHFHFSGDVGTQYVISQSFIALFVSPRLLRHAPFESIFAVIIYAVWYLLNSSNGWLGLAVTWSCQSSAIVGTNN